MTERFIVDGRMHDHPDSDYGSDGEFPPFVVFDVAEQRNLPGEYPQRHPASVVAGLLNAAQPRPEKPTGPRPFRVMIARTDRFVVNVTAEDADEAQDLALEAICQDENPDIDSSDGFEVEDVREVTNG